MWSIFNEISTFIGGSTSILAWIVYVLVKYKLDRKSGWNDT